jgi:uncharacterized protein YycO
MDLADLKPGDIVLFRTREECGAAEWLSGNLNQFLTNSPVRHAGMMIEGTKMVEVIDSGVRAPKIIPVDYDKVIVMRMKKEIDPQPLLNAAQKYLDAKVPYDFPALVLLGGFLVYRKIRPDKKLTAPAYLILLSAIKALDKWISHVKKKKGAMICSQLVYQIYKDCGKDYHIEIKHDFLQDNNSLDLASDDNSRTAKRLAKNVENIKKKLENLSKDLNFPVDSLFVAPGDLLKSESLVVVGEMSVKRD